MKNDPIERQKAALTTLERLLAEYRTASLATTDHSGSPHASYVPIAVDSEHNFYLFCSELAEHTVNLQSQGRASLILLEDESRSTQLFARNRLTVDGTIEPIGRDAQGWTQAAEVYRERFGKLFDQLVGLKDFHMFRLRPQGARLVVGFGAAYRVGLPDWTSLELLTGK